MTDFRFEIFTDEPGPTGWVNIRARVDNWIPPPDAKREPKESFYLAYSLVENRWAQGKDYKTAMHHPELLDQILAKYFEEDA